MPNSFLVATRPYDFERTNPSHHMSQIAQKNVAGFHAAHANFLLSTKPRSCCPSVLKLTPRRSGEQVKPVVHRVDERIAPQTGTASRMNKPDKTQCVVGHRSSIRRRISSAQRIASAIAVIVAGTLAPPSYWASFRAAKIEAAIRSTRFRPSSTNQDYHLSPCIRHGNHGNIYASNVVHESPNALRYDQKK